MPRAIPAFSRSLFAVLLLCLMAAQSARAEAPAATQPPVSFAGKWKTSFGPMSLTQKGDVVSGTYGPTANAITGKLQGRKFTFTYAEPNVAGEGSFDLADDGKSFKGRWHENGAKDFFPWEGTFDITASGAFTGLWNTTYGPMRLRQTANAVHGVYEFNDIRHITGTVAERVFTFHYEQSDGEKGDGKFELAADGESFTGTWKASKAAKGAAAGGEWGGKRVTPMPGVTWLVVLEANWEHGLQEQEYSFGLMLRTFFSRVPTVQVRHRFFGNEAEFRRWCNELPFLAEPIVLHISSHGTRDGIVCGHQLIGGDVLIDCLRDTGELRLLHFGTCLVAGGEIPKKIYQALGAQADYPISGYVNEADWGGSAVIDFTYLDLIFSRGLSPKDAVTQVRKTMTFSREKGEKDDAIAPAGLILYAPENGPTTQPAVGDRH